MKVPSGLRSFPQPFSVCVVHTRLCWETSPSWFFPWKPVKTFICFFPPPRLRPSRLVLFDGNTEACPLFFQMGPEVLLVQPYFMVLFSCTPRVRYPGFTLRATPFFRVPKAPALVLGPDFQALTPFLDFFSPPLFCAAMHLPAPLPSRGECGSSPQLPCARQSVGDRSPLPPPPLLQLPCDCFSYPMSEPGAITFPRAAASLSYLFLYMTNGAHLFVGACLFPSYLTLFLKLVQRFGLRGFPHAPRPPTRNFP